MTKGSLLFVVCIAIFLLAGHSPAAGSNRLSSANAELMQTAKQALDTTPPIPDPVAQIYSQAKTLLEKEQNDQARSAQLENEMRTAPERLVELKKELDKDPVKQLESPKANLTLAEAEARYSSVKNQLDAAEREQTGKANHLREQERLTGTLPDAMAAATAALDEAQKSSSSALPKDDPPGRSAAEVLRRKAAILSAEATIMRLENERSYASSMGAVMQSELSLAERNLDLAQATEQHWIEILKAKRQEQGFEWIKKTKDQRADFTNKEPALIELCNENVNFAEKMSAPDGVINRLREVGIRRKEMVSLQAELSRDFDDIQSRLELTGMNKAVGNLLIKHQSALPQVQKIKTQLINSRKELNNAQLMTLQLRENIAQARKEGSLLQDLRTRLHINDNAWTASEQDARTILRLRRDLLTEAALINAKYEKELSETIVAEQELIRTIGEMATFVNEEVLWVNNMPTFSIDDIQKMSQAAKQIEWRGTLTKLIQKTLQNIKTHPFIYILFLLLLIGLFASRSSAHKKISEQGQCIVDHPPGTLPNTLKTILWSGYAAAIWPLVIWLGSEWMEATRTEATLLHLAEALKIVAYYLLPIFLLLEITRKDGLGIIHLKLDPIRTSAMRRLLILIISISFPFLVVRSLALTFPGRETMEILGRLSTMMGQLLLASVYAITFKHNGPFVRGNDSEEKAGIIFHHWLPLYVPLVSTPLLLAAASAAGFQYSAVQIGGRLNGLVLMAAGLFIVQAIAVRVVWLLRRKRLMEEVQNRKLAGLEIENETTLELQKDLLKEAVHGVTSVSDGIIRLIRFGTWALFILGMYLMWEDILPAFNFLDRTNLYMIGEVQVTLGGLLAAILTLVVGTVIVRSVPGMLEVYLLPRTKLHPGERSAIATLIRYLLVVIVVLKVCSRLGLTWNSMHWMMAAMGVGIGFGLQEIFANLISGIMLLMDGRIRPLDIITVGDASGRVTAIRTLATTITDWNNRELIIPNKEFVTGRVTNWTLSEQTVRLDIPVGIAYGSDTRLVEETLIKVGMENENTLDNPPPQAMFIEFGDSSLNFELRVWVNMDKRLITCHGLNRAVDDAFREAGISIAFPQMDLHINQVDSDKNPGAVENPELVK